MSEVRNPFDVLGVTPADDILTIRAAWRAKVRALHPDQAKNKAEATSRLAEVNAAFDALQSHVPSAEAQERARAKRDERAEARAKAALKRRADAAERGRRRAAAMARAADKIETKQNKQPAVSPNEAKIRLRARLGYLDAIKSIKAA
ncbi:MAG: J domain-containing protein [Pseudomonadota bacterium]